MRTHRFLDRRVLLILLPLAAFGALMAYDRYAYDRLMEGASLLHADAKAFEARGELQGAFLRYSQLCEGVGLKRSDVPGGACESAQRLGTNIHKAYEDAMAALNRYRERAGRYPESLDSVRKDIPESSQAAFAGFKYNRESDSRISVSSGLDGSVVFDLKR